MKKKEKTKIIFYVILFLIIALNIYILLLNYKTAKSFSEVTDKTKYEPEEFELQKLNISKNPLSVEEYSKTNISLSENNIILSANCSAIGLITNEIQIYSIKQGISNTIDLRPTIHDITAGILENFNITILMVKITESQDEIYFSSIYMKSENEVLSVDAKPSDAIAIAVRQRAPVFIKNSILDKYGENIC